MSNFLIKKIKEKLEVQHQQDKDVELKDVKAFLSSKQFKRMLEGNNIRRNSFDHTCKSMLKSIEKSPRAQLMLINSHPYLPILLRNQAKMDNDLAFQTFTDLQRIVKGFRTLRSKGSQEHSTYALKHDQNGSDFVENMVSGGTGNLQQLENQVGEINQRVSDNTMQIEILNDKFDKLPKQQEQQSTSQQTSTPNTAQIEALEKKLEPKFNQKVNKSVYETGINDNKAAFIAKNKELEKKINASVDALRQKVENKADQNNINLLASKDELKALTTQVTKLAGQLDANLTKTIKEKLDVSIGNDAKLKQQLDELTKKSQEITNFISDVDTLNYPEKLSALQDKVKEIEAFIAHKNLIKEITQAKDNKLTEINNFDLSHATTALDNKVEEIKQITTDEIQEAKKNKLTEIATIDLNSIKNEFQQQITKKLNDDPTNKNITDAQSAIKNAIATAINTKKGELMEKFNESFTKDIGIEGANIDTFITNIIEKIKELQQELERSKTTATNETSTSGTSGVNDLAAQISTAIDAKIEKLKEITKPKAVATVTSGSKKAGAKLHIKKVQAEIKALQNAQTEIKTIIATNTTSIAEIKDNESKIEERIANIEQDNELKKLRKEFNALKKTTEEKFTQAANTVPDESVSKVTQAAASRSALQHLMELERFLGLKVDKKNTIQSLLNEFRFEDLKNFTKYGAAFDQSNNITIKISEGFEVITYNNNSLRLNYNEYSINTNENKLIAKCKTFVQHINEIKELYTTNKDYLLKAAGDVKANKKYYEQFLNAVIKQDKIFDLGEEDNFTWKLDISGLELILDEKTLKVKLNDFEINANIQMQIYKNLKEEYQKIRKNCCFKGIVLGGYGTNDSTFKKQSYYTPTKYRYYYQGENGVKESWPLFAVKNEKNSNPITTTFEFNAYWENNEQIEPVKTVRITGQNNLKLLWKSIKGHNTIVSDIEVVSILVDNAKVLLHNKKIDLGILYNQKTLGAVAKFIINPKIDANMASGGWSYKDYDRRMRRMVSGGYTPEAAHRSVQAFAIDAYLKPKVASSTERRALRLAVLGDARADPSVVRKIGRSKRFAERIEVVLQPYEQHFDTFMGA